MAYDPDNDDLKETNSDSVSIEQQICNAIYDNDIDELHMLLLEDVDLNKLGAYGKKGNQKITPLHIACSKKNLKAVKLLLKFKAKTNVKSFPSGYTPLHIAAMWAHHKIVALLLKNGANPKANNNKQKTPLQIIGSKYKQKQLNDPKIMEAKIETQILLLKASSKKKAKYFQDEIDQDIADAEDGLDGLKAESNMRIKKIQKAESNMRIKKIQKQDFSSLQNKTNRMKALKQKNTIGLCVGGGARDVNNFRTSLNNGQMPTLSSISYLGIFNEYYFDTTNKLSNTNMGNNNDEKDSDA
eukprot:9744_1